MTAITALPLDELEQLELTVDAGLGAALDALVTLRQRQAHLARGHQLWHEYVLTRFGDALARLRLPDGERQALVESMSAARVPVRRQADALGIAAGTVHNDRVALGLAAPRPPRPVSAPLPAPTGFVWEQAAEWLRRARDGQLRGVTGGLTLVELAGHAGWTEGKASGALSDCRRRGVAVRLEVRRAGQRVHELADVDAGQPEPGAPSPHR